MLNKEFTKEDMKSLQITRTTNPLTYLPGIWEQIYASYGKNYTFDPARSITEVSNNYGVYSSGEIIFPLDTPLGRFFNDEINTKAKRLVNEALSGSRDLNRYRVVITATLKILAHLIPDEDVISRIEKLANEVDKDLFIDYEYDYFAQIDRQIQRLQRATVYGIYYKDELIYIGQTVREPEQRFREHLKGFKTKSSELLLYNQYNIEDYSDLQFKILFSTSKGILQSDLDSIERALIITNKPKGNHHLPGREIIEEPTVQEETKQIINKTIDQLVILLDQI